MALSIEAAEFIAIIVESVLYGFAALLISVTLWALIRERNKHELSIVTLVGVCALAILSTLVCELNSSSSQRSTDQDTSISLQTGSTRIKGSLGPKGTNTYFLDSTKFTFKNTVYFLETLLADGILIYRCYIVWQNILIIAFPVLGWIGTVVAGVHTIWSIARKTEIKSQDVIFVHQTGQWVVSFYSVALVTNISATFILATKLWIAHKRTVKYFSSMSTHTSRSSFYPIILVIFECGALYSLALVAMLATYLCQSNAAYLVIDLIGQIIPITFSVVLLRAALARYQKNDPHNALSRLDFAAFVQTEPQSSYDRTMTLKAGVKSYQESDGDRIQITSSGRDQGVNTTESGHPVVNETV
ncbi:uncharacterized protein EV420DRAFT_1645997 [Desarmillaria tabescens]|uniref:Uncharacterized protein n=1 Tax=Armillaria tabescens TaxID=1929756 RepID=A0AA39K2A2_ARMTA|nr:uncharacterized protein EV420DRAFT_1645997 [Desarmillaria tabescens]KAK0452036.1 hypothetical protein EV420DRAFT_1645997 [Desarmillaria tabescens]